MTVMIRTGVMLCAWLMVLPSAVFADGHVRGGCVVGESAITHGRSDPEAIKEIQGHAQLYVKNFQKFRKSESGIRTDINKLLELDQWTQADIIEFTKHQTELLYLSVGKQLATGRIMVDELAGYVNTIRQKITDIEVELGCTVLPDL